VQLPWLRSLEWMGLSGSRPLSLLLLAIGGAFLAALWWIRLPGEPHPPRWLQRLPHPSWQRS
jgi:hypothetical protein